MPNVPKELFTSKISSSHYNNILRFSISGTFPVFSRLSASTVFRPGDSLRLFEFVRLLQSWQVCVRRVKEDCETYNWVMILN